MDEKTVLNFKPKNVRMFLSKWGNYVLAIDLNDGYTISFDIKKSTFEYYKKIIEKYTPEIVVGEKSVQAVR